MAGGSAEDSDFLIFDEDQERKQQKYLLDAIKFPIFYHIHPERLMFSYSTVNSCLSF